MFTLRRSTAAQIEARISAAAASPHYAGAHLAPAAAGLTAPLPLSFAHDTSESVLGRGAEVFVAAKHAFRTWTMFNLGWVSVANPTAQIVVDALIAVEAKTLGLWTLNLSRIVSVVDTAHRFGFVYATTGLHVEQGEERFLLQFHPDTASVVYRLEAVSRPRSPLARLGYPITRVFQRRFARDSHRCMLQAVRQADTLET